MTTKQKTASLEKLIGVPKGQGAPSEGAPQRGASSADLPTMSPPDAPAPPPVAAPLPAPVEAATPRPRVEARRSYGVAFNFQVTPQERKNFALLALQHDLTQLALMRLMLRHLSSLDIEALKAMYPDQTQD